MELCVNIDHVATLRNARNTPYPEPAVAAALVEVAGGHGITVHPREDQRHISKEDARKIRPIVAGRFTLEMAAVPAMVDLALEISPDLVTLVPEKREELTTEGGLNVKGQMGHLQKVIEKLKSGGITTSLFIDPDEQQIQASRDVGSAFVEIHTGHYADAVGEEATWEQFRSIDKAIEFAHKAGLRTNAGHGLHLHNTRPIAEIEGIEQLHIGHGIIARAVFVGLDTAVREILDILP
jgi:pyridoxine 5-phosphate synthase